MKNLSPTVGQQALHRRTTSPPPRLARLIELANSIPANKEFPKAPPKTLPRLVHDDASEASIFEPPESFRKAKADRFDRSHKHKERLQAVKTQVDAFPKTEFPVFRQFVGELATERMNEILKRSACLDTARRLLRGIAWKYGSGGLSILRTVGGEILAKEGYLTDLNSPLPLDSLLTSDERGTIQLTGLIRVLIGVEAVRIRLCPVCGLIYWAGRIDKPACSSKCSNVLRVRKCREGEKPRTKVSRRGVTSQRSGGTNGRR